MISVQNYQLSRRSGGLYFTLILNSNTETHTLFSLMTLKHYSVSAFSWQLDNQWADTLMSGPHENEFWLLKKWIVQTVRAEKVDEKMGSFVKFP